MVGLIHVLTSSWFILKGEVEFLDVWHESYAAVMRYSRSPDGHWVNNGCLLILTSSSRFFFSTAMSIYIQVTKRIPRLIPCQHSGLVCKSWVGTCKMRLSLTWRVNISLYSLDLLNYFCFATDWNIWRRNSGLPEMWDPQFLQATSFQYPLRPEFVESTWYLYRVGTSFLHTRSSSPIDRLLETHTTYTLGNVF